MFRANYDLSQAILNAGFDLSSPTIGSALDFGQVMSNEPAPARTVSFYATKAGKVSYSLTGSKAFAVTSIKVTEYVEGKDFSSGYEKVIEYSKSTFPVPAGGNTVMAVTYNQGFAPGVQTGKLSITVDGKTTTHTLKGTQIEKNLSLTVDSVTQSANSIMPQEAIVVNVSLDVKQNSGSNLTFALVDAPTGVKLAGDSVWVGKAGKSNQKFKIQTDATVADNPAVTCNVAVLRSDTQQPLATFPITFGVKREWLEWSYKRETGNQEVWGTLQLSSTGEFIWNVEAKNTSKLFSDQFFTAICFPGLYSGGVSPTVFTVGALPIASHKKMFFQFTGKIAITSFSDMKSRKLRSYLAINEGGPLAALGEFGNGVVDLFSKGFGGSSYDDLPNNFGGNVAKWMKNNNAKPIKLISAKAWI